MDQENYMSHPKAKTVGGFIEGLTILSGYMPSGMDESYFCGGEHDVIYIYVGGEKCPPDSVNGIILESLGFHYEDDAWSYFT